MIKGGRFPGRSGMTASTVLTKLAVVMVIFLMAGKAVRWRALEDAVDMTFFAERGRVNTGQLEGCQVVIKTGGFPGRSGMTTSAVLAKLTVVMVIFLMAGEAIRRGTLEDIIKMALFARH